MSWYKKSVSNSAIASSEHILRVLESVPRMMPLGCSDTELVNELHPEKPLKRWLLRSNTRVAGVFLFKGRVLSRTRPKSSGFRFHLLNSQRPLRSDRGGEEHTPHSGMIEVQASRLMLAAQIRKRVLIFLRLRPVLE